jgi:predicted HTH domain antitoxin
MTHLNSAPQTIVIEIPDVGLTEQQLRQELAVALFEQRHATLAKAADVAGLTRLDFQRLLAGRGIPVHYGLDEWAEDVQGLRDQSTDTPTP